MFHVLLRCRCEVWVSHYPGETTIWIDCNQLGETQNTHLYEPSQRLALGNLPPYSGYHGSDSNRKAQGTARSQVAQAMPAHGQSLSRHTYLLPSNDANLSSDPSPTRVTWLHSRNELSSRYVNGTFNLNQGPDNEAVLKWHRRDQEHRPSRPQQQHSNIGSRPVSSYPLSYGSFSW
jgi:hypothetical protein